MGSIPTGPPAVHRWMWLFFLRNARHRLWRGLRRPGGAKPIFLRRSGYKLMQYNIYIYICMLYLNMCLYMLILYIIYLSKFQLDLLMPRIEKSSFLRIAGTHQLPLFYRPTDYLYHEQLPLFVDICRHTWLLMFTNGSRGVEPPVTPADLCSKPIRGTAFRCRPVEDIGFGSFRHCPGIQSCAKHLGVSENGGYTPTMALLSSFGVHF